MDVFARNLEDENILSKKMRALLSVLTQASEFESIAIREGEEQLLYSLGQYCTYSLDDGKNQDAYIEYNEPHNKTNVLLQCHFNRRPLGIDLRID